MTVTNIAYSYYNMQSQPQNNAMPGMKWMMLLMPLMFLVFFNNYASGLSLYYFLFLLFTIVQMWVFRKVVNEDKLRAQMAASAKKTKKNQASWLALKRLRNASSRCCVSNRNRTLSADKRAFTPPPKTIGCASCE